MEGLLTWLRSAAGLDDGQTLPPIPEEILLILRALRERQEHLEGELKRTEGTLDFLKASANAMPNPIFIKDDQLRFVFFNRAYRELFKLEENQYIGMRVQDLEYLPPEDRERYHAEDREILENQ